MCGVLFLGISHIIQLAPQELSAEPRNSASAEALAVARRPSFFLTYHIIQLTPQQLSAELKIYFYTGAVLDG